MTTAKNSPAIVKTKRKCVLRSVVVETRRMVNYASFCDVMQLEQKPDDPLFITVQAAIKLSGLSRPTIDRLIAAGRQDSVAA